MAHEEVTLNVKVTNEMQPLFIEAMKRISDILEDVRVQLDEASKELLDKLYTDPDSDPEPVFVVGASDGAVNAALYAYITTCISTKRSKDAERARAMVDTMQAWRQRRVSPHFRAKK